MDELHTILSQLVVPVAVDVLKVLAPVVVGWIGVKLSQKLSTDRAAVLQEAVRGVVLDGVAKAEKLAETYGRSGNKLSSEHKLKLAVDYIKGELQRTKLDKLAEEVIVEKVEAALGR